MDQRLEILGLPRLRSAGIIAVLMAALLSTSATAYAGDLKAVASPALEEEVQDHTPGSTLPEPTVWAPSNGVDAIRVVGDDGEDNFPIPVPEPATVLLVVVGLLALGAHARKRRVS